MITILPGHTGQLVLPVNSFGAIIYNTGIVGAVYDLFIPEISVNVVGAWIFSNTPFPQPAQHGSVVNHGPANITVTNSGSGVNLAPNPTLPYALAPVSNLSLQPTGNRNAMFQAWVNQRARVLPVLKPGDRYALGNLPANSHIRLQNTGSTKLQLFAT